MSAKIHSASLHKKLKGYSLCAGSVLAASVAANAQVMYTDVNPDVVLENTAGALPFYASYALDLNNDSTADFDVVLSSHISGFYSVTTYIEGIIPHPDNKLAATSGNWLLSKFQVCGTVKQNNSGAQWANLIESFNFYLSDNLQFHWGPVIDFYTGFLITINGNQHYGWARFDINPDSTRKIVIKDYAYEATQDTPIVVGSCAVGIQEPKTEFKITPNPSDGKISLTTKNLLKGKTTVSITDVTGKQILTEAALFSPQGKFSLDLSSLNAGVYFITLENEKKTITNKWMKE